MGTRYVCAMKAIGLFGLLLVAAACGGDDDGGQAADAGPPDAGAGACGAAGSGEVMGETAGETVDPIATAFYTIDELAARIVLDEQLPVCMMEPNGPGERVAIGICDPELSAGEYTVVSGEDYPGNCPGERLAVAAIEDAVGNFLAISTSGTVTIDEVGDCLTGSFAITYDDDSDQTGSFDALACQ